MHTAIRIKNFRSIENTVFSVKNGLNVLVGPNGSGKTNILSALKFISLLLYNGAAVAMGKAGGPARNFRRGESEISFSVVSHYETGLFNGSQARFLLRWEVRVALSAESNLVHIAKESLQVLAPGLKDVIKIEVSRSSSSFRSSMYMEDAKNLTKKMVSHPRFTTSATKKTELFAAVEKELQEAVAQARKLPSDSSILPLLGWLHPSVSRLLGELTSFDEYNIQPEIARLATDPLPLTRMENNGAGVSEVINSLESGQVQRLTGRPNLHFGLPFWAYRNQPTWARASINKKENPLAEISQHVSAAVTTIDGITTDIDPSTGRRYIVFKSGGHKFRPEEVSDGTIKWLCLLVAVLVPQSHVIVLEEPENFMHPWMQQRFVSIVREQSKKRRSSVILTTHSATVLNSLLIRELLLVRQGERGTVVNEVKDKAALQKMLDATSFGLGDAWVSGAIEAQEGLST